jgi:hypothetical protein
MPTEKVSFDPAREPHHMIAKFFVQALLKWVLADLAAPAGESLPENETSYILIWNNIRILPPRNHMQYLSYSHINPFSLLNYST